MDKELKKGIKKLLWADSVITSSSSIFKILDEVEDELEELFGSSHDKNLKIEELYKIRKLK